MYTAHDYSALLGLEGFSDTLLKNHFTLYQGYVNNTNKLSDTLKTMLAEGKTAAPEYAELKRRFGFEFDGMRLHEYYFSNLGKSAPLSNTGKLYQALSVEFGSYQLWETDFKATASMRGIGWVILYKDPQTGRLFNQWINEHETGHLAGITPILVIDVFEHAFMTDYGLKRADYIAAFLKNINWDEAEKRFQD
ncbi:MAG: superoxide dismutase [Dehalococcoides mccartyi]|uniref:superoxide dismutase n=1 Tax=Dehalococcoides TaxID=61434 RepID=UPI0019F7AEFF|nr:superoxide dismutase [Dehalococcoides mccartyi]MBF4483021.1 superoxide dismutase [Dehalococcoides mccartyi]MBJ7531979.1 superoxide dismutase [Dehalococcoides mccartyi]MDP4280317.1 superoxide dismutase [Dehalococcoides mccartyi]